MSNKNKKDYGAKFTVHLPNNVNKISWNCTAKDVTLCKLYRAKTISQGCAWLWKNKQCLRWRET